MAQNDGDRPDAEGDGSLASLDKRLQAAKTRRGGRRKGAAGNEGRSDAMGAGMRIAVEMVAAILVGTGIGIVLDKWLGTQPWLLILFFVIGCVAAFLNVYRVGQELDREARERRAADRAKGK